ncbi:unnamed protein product [Arabis nemorensis]|uniref:Uncharacterized protein n=1 Tax=Arabis nemorensis TaxID=586526 RepID=A0A565AKW7_9BRAS|nr:unnamed protein product [Arabis nemorensis]
MMRASFHVMTPLVGIRETTFTRRRVRRPNGDWLVFDLPMNDNEQQLPFIRGCLVSRNDDQVPGISRVTWLQLAQYRLPVEAGLLEGGRGFGSRRWFETLARECRLARGRKTVSCFGSKDDPHLLLGHLRAGRLIQIR